jgi:hypothetical protein
MIFSRRGPSEKYVGGWVLLILFELMILQNRFIEVGCHDLIFREFHFDIDSGKNDFFK